LDGFPPFSDAETLLYETLRERERVTLLRR
jgi:hypothetical protein